MRYIVQYNTRQGWRMSFLRKSVRQPIEGATFYDRVRRNTNGTLDISKNGFVGKDDFYKMDTASTFCLELIR